MSILTRHRDGAQAQLEHHLALDEEFRHRAADAQRAREAAVAAAGPTAEQAELEAKRRVEAGIAARAQRNAAVQRFIDLKSTAAVLAAQAEVERNAALESSDIERAVAAQTRAMAASALVAAIDEDIRRRFPPTGLHF